ncbi:MAG: class I SAM-dependent methyltransferase [Flavobacteriaceae bacterium]|nr:class I SAM-dependent methyltransferase [Flavobacteriaceae bacterium]
MKYMLLSYLNYLFRSTNKHGIHSPFVYDLVTKCFNDKKRYPVYSILLKHRKSLQKSKERIEVTDFGAGSRIFKDNQRRVSKIAKNAGISVKRQRLLYRLTRYFGAEKILELGTSVGLGTVALALGSEEGRVKTVEGCPNTAWVAQTHFKQFNIDTIELHNQSFESFFKNDASRYDLVYVDGNHDKSNTLNYFHLLLDRIHNNSVIIFDDIYWSPEMTAAWEEIKGHDRVTVSIDTFQWGMVFFRKEQTKQHFTLRL